jgi:hypothetical protein
MTYFSYKDMGFWSRENHNLSDHYPSQLILCCRWYALLLARTVSTQLALCEALDVTGRRLFAMSGRLAVEVGWRCCCLKDCWECLLFTDARSMGRDVQWSPMKPDSWFGWFPLKSSPTCSCRWLHCDLQNVPHYLDTNSRRQVCFFCQLYFILFDLYPKLCFHRAIAVTFKSASLYIVNLAFLAMCFIKLYSPFVGPWPLFQFTNLIHSRYDSLDGVSVRRKAAIYTQDNKSTHKHPCLQWDSNKRPQCWRGRRQFMP